VYRSLNLVRKNVAFALKTIETIPILEKGKSKTKKVTNVRFDVRTKKKQQS
jgi:hypothetical protein